VKGTLGLGLVKGIFDLAWLMGTQFRIGERDSRLGLVKDTLNLAWLKDTQKGTRLGFVIGHSI